MLVVPDAQRKFPPHEVPYLDINQVDLFEFLLALKRANCPNWTDESSSDVGVQLLHIYSVMGDWLVKHMERVKNDCFITTTTNRETMRALCALIGYTLAEAQPASVTVTLTHTVPHAAFVIEKGTRFSTSQDSAGAAIVFESVSDVNVPVDQATTDVLCRQGETISNKTIGSSDGNVHQEFLIGSGAIIWQSESVEVHNGSSWATWTRVTDFVDSGPTDPHYRVEIQNDDDYVIVFGDGTTGKIPEVGTNNIRATFRTGGGQIGNVSASTIEIIVDSIQDTTSVTNTSDASGGTDRESLEHARLHAPASLRRLDRAITLEDIENIAKEYTSTIYGGIATAKAIAVGPQAVSMMMVPTSGGNPSSGHKAELQSYIAARTILGVSVQVIDPRYKLINVVADVYLHKNYNATEVHSEVRARLVKYITPTYQDPASGVYEHDFGRNIRLSDLYATIDNTPGVDYCSIATPSGDVIVDNEEIANVGSINLTVHSDAGTFTYHSTKHDVLKQWKDRVISDGRAS